MNNFLSEYSVNNKMRQIINKTCLICKLLCWIILSVMLTFYVLSIVKKFNCCEKRHTENRY